MIRLARRADFARLQEIETLAGAAFRDVGMPEIADDEPFDDTELETFARDGRAWVVEADGEVAGYLLVEVLDDCAHIAQVSVDPRWRGKRLGASLIDHAQHWGACRGLAGVTLTTFRGVPWNEPHYLRLGFHPVPANGALAEVVAREAAAGLDPGRRVCLRRDVGQGWAVSRE